MTDHDMKAELERLRKENEALKKGASEGIRMGASEGIRMKVSEKGAVSIYGMGRFPVTLYKEQWLKLLKGCGSKKRYSLVSKVALMWPPTATLAIVAGWP